MLNFRDLPIKYKLIAIILLICGLVIFLTFAVFITNELIAFRQTTIHNLSTLAKVIGINSTAALTFQDPETAQEILSALNVEPSVQIACIFTDTGDVFAAYRNENFPSVLSADHQPVGLAKCEEGKVFSQRTYETYRFSLEYLELARPISLNEKLIGKVFIRANLKGLYSRLKWFGIIMIFATIGLLLLAYLTSSHLQRIISEPISTLAQTIKTVSHTTKFFLNI